jgi:hypothetical protein
MRLPTQCVLWDKPELILEPVGQRFELLETYEEESHFWRYLLKCRECSQLYFYEFYEEIDWEKGNDAQQSTYVPVNSQEEAEILKMKSSFELQQCFPRLQKAFPKDAERPVVDWLKKA